MGVCFYIVLSGFITHYTAATNSLYSPKAYAQYIVLKFMRIAPSYYAALILMCLADTKAFWGGAASWHGIFNELVSDPWNGVEGHWLSPVAQAAAASPSPLLMLHAWRPHTCLQFLNVPTWTISTLLFCWLFYPAVQSRLVSSSTRSVAWLAVVGFVVSIAVTVVYRLVLGTTTPAICSAASLGQDTMYHWLYRYPLARFPDYFTGCCCAELYARPAVRRWAGWRYVADICAAAAFVLPFYGGWIVTIWQGVDCVGYFSSLTPLYAALLLSTSCAPQSRAASLFSQPVLSGLGAGSLSVYLFQLPWFTIYRKMELRDGEPDRGWKLHGGYVAEFLLTIWTFALVWSRVDTVIWVRVVRPFVQFVFKLDVSYGTLVHKLQTTEPSSNSLAPRERRCSVDASSAV